MTTVFERFGLPSRVVRNRTEGYALELEVEFEEPCDLNHDMFTTTHDGSLMNYGYEYVSRGPFSIDDLVSGADEVFEQYPDTYVDTERTSTHVHVNVQNWTPDALLSVLCTYYLVEDLLFNFAGRERLHNLYCLPITAAEGSIDYLDNLYEDNLRECRNMFDQVKYAALNVANITRLGTIEFRHMRGLRDTETLEKWLRLIECIVESRRRFRTPEQVWDAYLANPVEFAKGIFGEHFDAVDDAELEYRLDMSYSVVYRLLTMNERSDIRKQDMPRFHNYIFRDEQFYDDHDNERNFL